MCGYFKALSAVMQEDTKLHARKGTLKQLSSVLPGLGDFAFVSKDGKSVVPLHDVLATVFFKHPDSQDTSPLV